MSFSKKNLIYVFVISALSTQTLIQSQIDLGFHCIYLENTWNFVSPEKWTHFWIFITKICMKVPGIWHTKKGIYDQKL